MSDMKNVLSFPDSDSAEFSEWKQQPTTVTFSEREATMIQNAIFNRASAYYQSAVEREQRGEDATSQRIQLDELNMSLKFWMKYKAGDEVVQIDAGVAETAVLEWRIELITVGHYATQDEGKRVLEDLADIVAVCWGARL